MHSMPFKLRILMQRRGQQASLLVLLTLCLFLNGCVYQRGIAGHGGGKRFTVEQKLLSRATHSTLSEFDFQTLRGKRVALIVNMISDTSHGNIASGKLQINTILRKEYVKKPKQTERYEYEVFQTTETESFVLDEQVATEGEQVTESQVIPIHGVERTVQHHTRSTTQQQLKQTSHTYQTKGEGYEIAVEANQTGIGNYYNSVPAPTDEPYVVGLLKRYLVAQGVILIDAKQSNQGAQVDAVLYASIDVFGINRSRFDVIAYNSERLIAETAIEIMAIDTRNNQPIMSPQLVNHQSWYKEDFLFWVGPIRRTEATQPSLNTILPRF